MYRKRMSLLLAFVRLIVLFLAKDGHDSHWASGWATPQLLRRRHCRFHPARVSTGSIQAPSTNSNQNDNSLVDDDFSLEAFQSARENRQQNQQQDDVNDSMEPDDNEESQDDEFSGYDFRDILHAKWGQCFDVDFNRVDYMGSCTLYLNILPFYVGRKPFRHETEYDYLCHLQAVVEILLQYDQLGYILYQIGETNKRPVPGRSPIVAVPCRLDLTEEQVNAIVKGKR